VVRASVLKYPSAVSEFIVSVLWIRESNPPDPTAIPGATGSMAAITADVVVSVDGAIPALLAMFTGFVSANATATPTPPAKLDTTPTKSAAGPTGSFTGVDPIPVPLPEMFAVLAA
jgi:hypothetical protein